MIRSRYLSGSTLLAILSCSCFASIAATPIQPSSVLDAGRNVMRTADGGGLVAAFVRGDGLGGTLTYSSSRDNGQTWRDLKVATSGKVIESAIDSNFEGAYIAFTEHSGTGVHARIAYASAPLAAELRVELSPAVTPPGVEPKDTFVQASRSFWGTDGGDAGRTVVYGWQDGRTKALYVGVSLDGRTFPMARKTVDDRHAVSGPAVSIHGKRVLATYLTTHPDIVPVDVPASQRQGRAYQAYVESLDGGRSWSKPQPLFGRRSSDYPVVDVEVAASDGSVRVERVRLDRGTAQVNRASLTWVSEEMGEMVSFAQSSAGGGTADGVRVGEVGVVSRKSMKDGAAWNHAVAIQPLKQRRLIGKAAADPSSERSQFQYSALPDSLVRMTTYVEHEKVTGKVRLVMASSTDGGFSFSGVNALDAKALSSYGVPRLSADTVVEVSQCLFEDRDGAVHVDLMVLDQGMLRYVRVPIGVNAAALRESTRQKSAAVVAPVSSRQ